MPRSRYGMAVINYPQSSGGPINKTLHTLHCIYRMDELMNTPPNTELPPDVSVSRLRILRMLHSLAVPVSDGSR